MRRFFKSVLARARRDFTVPAETPRITEISLQENPWMSLRTTIDRCSGESFQSACWMESARSFLSNASSGVRPQSAICGGALTPAALSACCSKGTVDWRNRLRDQRILFRISRKPILNIQVLRLGPTSESSDVPKHFYEDVLSHFSSFARILQHAARNAIEGRVIASDQFVVGAIFIGS